MQIGDRLRGFLEQCPFGGKQLVRQSDDRVGEDIQAAASRNGSDRCRSASARGVEIPARILHYRAPASATLLVDSTSLAWRSVSGSLFRLGPSRGFHLVVVLRRRYNPRMVDPAVGELLGGLSSSAFLRRHWQKKPLLVRQAVQNFRGLLSRAELFALAARDDVESRLVRRRRGRWTLAQGPFHATALSH